MYGQKDYQTFEFVVFRTDDNKLNKNKATINVERTVGNDWDISDEVQALDFPYLYFINGSSIQIISMLTSKWL